MPILTAIVLGLSTGIIFGFALEKSRAFEPGLVIAQVQLRNFTLIKVWLSAAATAVIGVTLCNEMGVLTMHPQPLLVVADLFGGALAGAGLVMAGGCPAMIMAQLGTGYRDAWFALAGALAGVMAGGVLQPALQPFLSTGLTVRTVPELSTMPFLAWGVAVAVMLFAGIMALERLYPWPSDGDAAGDGTGDYPEPAPPEAQSVEFYDPEQTPTHEVLSPPEAR